VLFVRWNGNKCLTIGTNFDTIDPLAAVARWNRGMKQKVGISQSRDLKTYNSHMGGVDHHEWLVGQYAIGVRGKKWYWVLFTRMIDMTLVNAWLLYRHTHGVDALDILSFKRAVTLPYLKLDTSRKQPGRPLSSPYSYVRVILDVGFDGVGHVKRDKRSREDAHDLVAKENPGHSAQRVKPLFAFSVLHHTIIIENIVMIQQTTVLQIRNRCSL
jgi:hypothetical protein